MTQLGQQRSSRCLSTLGRLQGQLLHDRHNSYAQERHYPENATNLSEQ